MPNVTEIATQLSDEAKTDAATIEAIIKTAAEEIQAVLDKYKDVPADVSLPALSPARNALANITMQFPPTVAAKTLPLPPLVRMPA